MNAVAESGPGDPARDPAPGTIAPPSRRHSPSDLKGANLAGPKYQYEKRQKDLAKKKKQEEKRQRKAARKEPGAPEEGQEPPVGEGESVS
jgi:hypothetical protein